AATRGPPGAAQLRGLRGQAAKAPKGTQPPHRAGRGGARQTGGHLQAGAGDGGAGRAVDEGAGWGSGSLSASRGFRVNRDGSAPRATADLFAVLDDDDAWGRGPLGGESPIGDLLGC